MLDNNSGNSSSDDWIKLGYGKDGELLYLIGTSDSIKLKAVYRRSWAIEVFFQALKNRGFKLEESCLRDINKYRKLFAVVSVAYAICWATGIQSDKLKPVKVKKHGYPQYSVFRRGLNQVREFLTNKIAEPATMAID